ncbi:MAG: nucleotidyltransferase domain-containing protein [Actinomycetota bacterium]|nr:nucleotidyltransferase domain-containing protein [Actinomycetota bacterium]
MRATYTAEDVLGTRSKVRVLRVLHGVRVPLNASQIGYRTKLSQPAVSAALEALADMGLVESASAGRARVHWLVRENVYVREMVDPVFQTEAAVPEMLETDVKTAFGRETVSIVLFGSYARGDQDAESDIDLVMVVADEALRARLDNFLSERLGELGSRWGARLSAIVYSAAEAAGLHSGSSAFYESLANEGVVVSGMRPGDWRRHGQEEGDASGSGV